MIEDPLIGKQLANFLVERILGRGGMAQVYYGQDIKLQRPVAIKVIDARYRNNPAYAQRFVKEARAVARWRHENIIQIYYADDEDGLYYFVMEYIDGHDLSYIMESYADDGELMPANEVIRIGKAIASALDYAHHHGVIHRDVKPSNVYISKDGRVVLGDFGLALDVGQGSIGEAFGSPHYIAPEQSRRSSDVVPQSDLYSLGVILYEMLTGSVPFDDISPTSVALQHLTEPPPLPRSINPQLSEATEAVLLKALEKDPQNRYQTGIELMHALEKALADEQTTRQRNKVIPLPPMPAGITAPQNRIKPAQPVALATPSPLPPAARPQTEPRRSPWRIAWMLLGALVILLGAGWIFSPKLIPILFPPTATRPLPTPTRENTATLAPVLPTETDTVTPSITPTGTPTRKATASRTPTNAVTEAPSASSTPSLTVTASQTATETPTPAPTVLYPDGKRFVMFYDENGFYLLNASDANRSISPIAFELLDSDGTPLNHTDGWFWGSFYPTLHPTRCIKTEISGSLSYLDPAECHNRYLVERLLPRNDPSIFWTTSRASTQFRVLWQDEEVGRCEIAAGECEIFVP